MRSQHSKGRLIDTTLISRALIMLKQKLDAMPDLTEEERNRISTMVALDLTSMFVVVDLVSEEILDACIAKHLKIHKKAVNFKLSSEKAENKL